MAPWFGLSPLKAFTVKCINIGQGMGVQGCHELTLFMSRVMVMLFCEGSLRNVNSQSADEGQQITDCACSYCQNYGITINIPMKYSP